MEQITSIVKILGWNSVCFKSDHTGKLWTPIA